MLINVKPFSVLIDSVVFYKVKCKSIRNQVGCILKSGLILVLGLSCPQKGDDDPI